MALKLQKTYTNKEGKEIELKTPKMKIMGKLMDADEIHRFKVLVNEIKIWKNNAVVKGVQKEIESYQMYVKYETDELAFNLDLSKQIYFVLNQYSLQVGDIMEISKGSKEEKDSGVIRPTVEVKILRNDKEITPEAQPTKEDTGIDVVEFVKKYRESQAVDKQTVNDCIGVFMKTHFKEDIKELLEEFDKK